MALLNEYIALDFGNKNKMIIEMSFLIATNIDSVMRSSLKLNWFLFFYFLIVGPKNLREQVAGSFDVYQDLFIHNATRPPFYCRHLRKKGQRLRRRHFVLWSWPLL